MEYYNKFLLGTVKHVKGNASQPASADNRIITLFCTNDGDFESVKENGRVAKVFGKAKDLYRGWWRSQRDFKDGNFQTEQVQSDTQIAHILVMDANDDGPTFNMDNVKLALDKFGKYCSQNKYSMHVNKTGTDEEWEAVMPIISETCVKRGVNVFVYSDE